MNGVHRTGEPHRLLRLQPGHRVELPDARRTDRDRLSREIRAISESPVVTAVLEVADVALFVLNRDRQIVGSNGRIDTVAHDHVLGLRPGETLGCTNAAGPTGCGAATPCATCGALAAVIECQERGRPVESECFLRCSDGPRRSLEFNVRATPLIVAGEPFTVVSMRDISSEKRREMLEQVFFHDVLNVVAGLRGWAQRRQRPGSDLPRASERIDFLAAQVEREIKDHHALVLAEEGSLVPERLPFRTTEVLRDLVGVFTTHPVARDRHLDLRPAPDDPELVSDRALLLRVLVNMVRNALEATPPGGVVRLSCESAPRVVSLHVQNAGVMDPEVQARVFQRSFSTKGQRGRGLGTYSMKLFGEHFLGGTVAFQSSTAAGTVFTISLPRRVRGALRLLS